MIYLKINKMIIKGALLSLMLISNISAVEQNEVKEINKQIQKAKKSDIKILDLFKKDYNTYSVTVGDLVKSETKVRGFFRYLRLQILEKTDYEIKFKVTKEIIDYVQGALAKIEGQNKKTTFILEGMNDGNLGIKISAQGESTRTEMVGSRYLSNKSEYRDKKDNIERMTDKTKDEDIITLIVKPAYFIKSTRNKEEKAKEVIRVQEKFLRKYGEEMDESINNDIADIKERFEITNAAIQEMYKMQDKKAQRQEEAMLNKELELIIDDVEDAYKELNNMLGDKLNIPKNEKERNIKKRLTERSENIATIHGEMRKVFDDIVKIESENSNSNSNSRKRKRDDNDNVNVKKRIRNIENMNQPRAIEAY